MLNRILKKKETNSQETNEVVDFKKAERSRKAKRLLIRSAIGVGTSIIGTVIGMDIFTRIWDATHPSDN